MKPQLKYGLLVGLAAFVVFIALNFVDEDRGSILSLVRIMVLFSGIYFAMKDTREAVGSISFGRALGIGMLTTLVAGGFNAIGQYAYCKFFDHDYITKLRVLYKDALENSTAFRSSQQQMDMVRGMTNWAVSPGSVSMFNLVAVIILGYMLSLIIALIIRRQDPAGKMTGMQ